MTLNDILNEAYLDLNYTGSIAPNVTTRLTAYANQCVRRILGQPGMERLQDSNFPFTFTSVSTQFVYTLPEAVAQIRAIEDRTNQQKLRMMTMEDYRTYAPDPTRVNGTPEAWIPIGVVAVALQPSVADQIWMTSTSASDTQLATIEGVGANGQLRTDTVTLNGASPVQFAAYSNWIEITDCFLASSALGTVTMLQTSGSGTVLTTIYPGKKRSRQYAFYLWPTPATGLTYYVDYRRETMDMVQLADEPPLPTDYHWLVPAYIRMREYEQKADPRYATVKAEYLEGLSRLKNFILNPPDYRPVAGKLPVRGGSNLGAWYPDGIWPGINY